MTPTELPPSGATQDTEADTSAPVPRVAFTLTQDRGGPVDVCLALAEELVRTGAAEVAVFGPPPARGVGALAGRWTETGVDTISSGWITHSAPTLDIGLDVVI